MNKLPLSFYQRDNVVALSRELLGKYLFTCVEPDHIITGGMIIETDKKDIPHAILIRAIQPEIGIELMLKRRHPTTFKTNLANGPGTLCQALGITRKHNDINLNEDRIWIEDHNVQIPPENIHVSTRIGIDYAEEDATKPWRFFLS